MTRASDADELAAPLDAMLVDAALGPWRRFLPNSSVATWVGKLAASPGQSLPRVGTLATQIGEILRGRSDIAAEKGDRRFADPAWQSNPILRRVMQSYIATTGAVGELIDVADLDWRDGRQVRFFAEQWTEALAPSNVPLLNPTSLKVAVDQGGLSLARGARNFVNDLRESPRIPEMVDTSGFTVGENLAATPGAVVFRSEVLEVIQYTPQSEKVHSVPLLVVPPTINKFYAIDLAPERSLVEFLVRSGQQVFMISWRNPDARHADWGLATYVHAVVDALGAVEKVTGADRTLVAGACSGGIIAATTLGYLAGRGDLERIAGLTLLVTVIDSSQAGDVAALTEGPYESSLAAAAKAMSRRAGYMDGRKLAEVFAWLRPRDLVWNYWVNNYLCGNKPPAFDILVWNADTTRMSAQLHADFIDLAMGNLLTEPGAIVIDDVPIDLSKIDVDAYIVAGISDHITPWENCYRTISLLGGASTFVLSRSGHIAALVNPPTNPKANFQLNPDNVPDAADWLQGATTEPGSWWPHWDRWLAERSGADKPAPAKLGSRTLKPLADAPGTYVFET